MRGRFRDSRDLLDRSRRTKSGERFWSNHQGFSSLVHGPGSSFNYNTVSCMSGGGGCPGSALGGSAFEYRDVSLPSRCRWVSLSGDCRLPDCLGEGFLSGYTLKIELVKLVP